MAMIRVFWLGLLVAGLSVSGAGALVLTLPAEEVAASSGVWNNLNYCFADDDLYATGQGLANGSLFFRVNLADPAGTDTLNRRISRVVIYAKGYSSSSKARIRLRPFFSGSPGSESASQIFGLNEVIRSYDITNQIASWRWQDLAGLSVQFTPRTAATFFINYIFAQVTCFDTSASQQAHRFQFAPIPSPETLAVYFPITIYAHDSLGNLASSYNGTATLWDSTGTILPLQATFSEGISNLRAAIFDVGYTAITAEDGPIVGVSNRFEVINPGLYRFIFGPVASLQMVGVPFGVSLAACDFFGDTIKSFDGRVDLWDLTSSLSPDSSGQFSAGVWSGSVTVAAAIPRDTIFCSYTSSQGFYTGASNGFEVRAQMGTTSGPTQPSLRTESFNIRIGPNPMRSQLIMDLWLPGDGQVQVSLFNLLGQVVMAKDLGTLAAGVRSVNWQFEKPLKPGVYFLVVSLDNNNRLVRKVLAVP